MVADDVARGSLMMLLPAWQVPPLPVQAVSLLSERHSAKVRAVVDFYAMRLRPAFHAREPRGARA